eukprot:c52098_g1_i1 orf=8-223(-)
MPQSSITHLLLINMDNPPLEPSASVHFTSCLFVKNLIPLATPLPNFVSCNATTSTPILSRACLNLLLPTHY